LAVLRAILRAFCGRAADAGKDHTPSSHTGAAGEASSMVRKAYTGGVEEERQERKGLSPYAKAGAYAGLAFVTPISGYVCYKIGQWLDRQYGTGYLYLVGLIVGCAAGMYETVRQAVRIEGLDKRR
jgi:hypothetical protein